jgi:hypothetical protein
MYKVGIDLCSPGCEVSDNEFLAVVARRIWQRHNEVVFGSGFTHPQKVILEANQSIANFLRAIYIYRDKAPMHHP